jgi:type I restriction enzyme S subunit
MKLSHGYKKTDIGVIPKDWVVERLGKLGSVVRGGSPRPAGDPRYFNGSYIPWLTVAALTNVSDYRIEITDTVGCLTEEGSKHSRILEKGTLIIANSGATLGIAKLLGVKCCANDGIAAIVGQKRGDKTFLSYYINTQTNHLREVIATGNGQPNLNTGLIKDILVPFPDEDEQRAIATALGDVDALLEGLERLIAKKRDLKQAVMQQLLTGQTRLPGFTGNWEVNTLGEIANVKTGPFGSSLHESDYVESGTPIITVQHLGEFRVEHFNLPRVSDFDWNRLRAYELKVGDLVFSRVGSVDRNALIRESEEGWLFSGRLLRVRPDNQKAYAPFLSYQFHAETFLKSVREVAVGQTMACLNTQILKGVPVCLPPLPEQTAIAAVLTDMDAEIEALEKRLAKSRDLKQAMMQELLTGKTRLVAAEMAHA